MEAGGAAKLACSLSILVGMISIVTGLDGRLTVWVQELERVDQARSLRSRASVKI